MTARSRENGRAAFNRSIEEQAVFSRTCGHLEFAGSLYIRAVTMSSATAWASEKAKDRAATLRNRLVLAAKEISTKLT